MTMDSKLIKHSKAFPKPSLLKDYLMDDMSSCSSNGFKSFPRKQCCPSTVRFLVEIDLNLNQQKKYFIRNISTKSAASAFHRFIAAVKRLPFGSSPEKKPILPRNLSRKIIRKSIFWKRKSSYKEIQRLKSFDQLMKEDSPPLDVPSDGTAPDAFSTGNSSSHEVKLNFTEVKREEEEDDDDDALENGDVSADSTTGGATKSSTEEKQWSVSEEKEQFSPVSVLDCPFDDDEEISSPFQHMQGSRKPKNERFGCDAAVDPLNLSKRFESTEEDEDEPEEYEAKPAEQKAIDLLHQVMDTKAADSRLLLDFFIEKTISMRWGDDDLIREAERWINSSTTTLIRDAFLGWNRNPYVEESREWRCFDGEIGEMALELEGVVFEALFGELVVDISSALTIV
ncbi:uncharacterized protein LOC130994664 [Salvia miltiorrhiza]|uniref:uncharacterized protein LOC130994664 n=1 Tax=Salvia miltiorrhiza TaxID=226208 RepID=UPI0025ABC2F7|nr:uncharacterized protein LOC130994664 [Salvia miltiorrhiza]